MFFEPSIDGTQTLALKDPVTRVKRNPFLHNFIPTVEGVSHFEFGYLNLAEKLRAVLDIPPIAESSGDLPRVVRRAVTVEEGPAQRLASEVLRGTDQLIKIPDEHRILEEPGGVENDGRNPQVPAGWQLQWIVGKGHSEYVARLNATSYARTLDGGHDAYRASSVRAWGATECRFVPLAYTP